MTKNIIGMNCTYNKRTKEFLRLDCPDRIGKIVKVSRNEKTYYILWQGNKKLQAVPAYFIDILNILDIVHSILLNKTTNEKKLGR